MGAWGHGILQNDGVQDELCGVFDGIADDVRKLSRRRPDEKVAARAGAAVGMLLQLSAGYWLSEERERSGPAIRAVLERQRPAFDKLPPAAAVILTDVLEGKGPELAHRKAPADERLARAFYGNRQDGFPMERQHGLREPSLFEHPEAARYVQEVADRLVKQLDRGFAAGADVLADLAREGDFLAALAVLLVIAPCRVDPDKFASWRARFRAALAESGDADPDEADFVRAYNACVELAFTLGIEKFSAC
jgi:hypothetical protein